MGTTSRPPSTTGGGATSALETQLLEPLLETSLECVRSLPCFAGVQLRVGLSGPFLKTQFLGSVIPVVDLLRQPVLHRGLGLVDSRHRPPTNLANVIRHDVRDCVRLSVGFQVARQPGGLWAGQNRGEIRLGRLERPEVQVRRVVQMPGLTRRVQLDVEHSLRDDAAVATASRDRVLNRVLQVEDDARRLPGSRSSTSTAPRRSRSRWRSSVRSMVVSSSGWPGNTYAASGCP